MSRWIGWAESFGGVNGGERGDVRSVGPVRGDDGMVSSLVEGTAGL